MGFIREYGVGITLGVLLTVCAFGLFADLAYNGPLATPGKTFTALVICGIALLATNVVTAMIAVEVTESRAWRRAQEREAEVQDAILQRQLSGEMPMLDLINW